MFLSCFKFIGLFNKITPTVIKVDYGNFLKWISLHTISLSHRLVKTMHFRCLDVIWTVTCNVIPSSSSKKIKPTLAFLYRQIIDQKCVRHPNRKNHMFYSHYGQMAAKYNVEILFVKIIWKFWVLGLVLWSSVGRS